MKENLNQLNNHLYISKQQPKISKQLIQIILIRLIQIKIKPRFYQVIQEKNLLQLLQLEEEMKEQETIKQFKLQIIIEYLITMEIQQRIQKILIIKNME